MQIMDWCLFGAKPVPELMVSDKNQAITLTNVYLVVQLYHAKYRHRGHYSHFHKMILYH